MKKFDYISIVIPGILLLFTGASFIQRFFVIKGNKEIKFEMRKIGVLEFTTILLNSYLIVGGFEYANNSDIGLMPRGIISVILGTITTLILKMFYKNRIDQEVRGINIEDMKSYVYEILEKNNISYKEVNYDSDWLKDIRIEYCGRKAKIELQRQGDEITLVLIRNFTILPCYEAIITSLRSIAELKAFKL